MDFTTDQASTSWQQQCLVWLYETGIEELPTLYRQSAVPVNAVLLGQIKPILPLEKCVYAHQTPESLASTLADVFYALTLDNCTNGLVDPKKNRRFGVKTKFKTQILKKILLVFSKIVVAGWLDEKQMLAILAFAEEKCDYICELAGLQRTPFLSRIFT